MEDFTIKNYFKHWVKIWPLTAILVVAGLVGGLIYNSTQKQSYTAVVNVMIVNVPDATTSSDYQSIANSKDLVAKPAIESLDLKDAKCSISATAKGNVITMNSTCGSSAEDADKLAAASITTFETASRNTIASDAIAVNKISSTPASADISTLSRIIKIALFAIVGLAISAFVAFVILDRKTSTKKTK